MTLVRAVDAPSSSGARSWVELMSPAVELAKAIAATEFVPRAMRHNAAAISAAILYGDEVGLGPMQSLAKIAVIDGRPTLAAEAQRALVFAAGHELWLDELTATRATWCGRRAGTDNVTRITWTMDRARKARLDGKDNWRKYPEAMLSARASADLVRAMFADVVGGLGATEEFEGELELADETAVGDDRRERAAGESGARRRRRRPGAAVAAAPAPGIAPPTPTVPPLPGEPDNGGGVLTVDEVRDAEGVEPSTMSDAQRRRMMGGFARLGYRGNTAEVRARRLELTRQIVGRPELESSAELTADEANRVIDYLEAEPEPDAGPDDEAGA